MSYVYLMRSSTTGWYKIGYSKDPESRREQLNKETSGLDWAVTYTFSSSNPFKLEQCLHKIFREHRITKGKEWFDLPEEGAELFKLLADTPTATDGDEDLLRGLNPTLPPGWPKLVDLDGWLEEVAIEPRDGRVRWHFYIRDDKYGEWGFTHFTDMDTRLSGALCKQWVAPMLGRDIVPGETIELTDLCSVPLNVLLLNENGNPTVVGAHRTGSPQELVRRSIEP